MTDLLLLVGLWKSLFQRKKYEGKECPKTFSKSRSAKIAKSRLIETLHLKHEDNERYLNLFLLKKSSKLQIIMYDVKFGNNLSFLLMGFFYGGYI